MRKRLNLTYILALFVLIGVLIVPVTSFAQDDDHSDDETAEVTDGEEGAEAEEEASVSPLAPLGINQGFLIAQIFNFMLVFGLLGMFMWRPLMNMLDSRATTIAKGLEDANAAANARRNAETEAEKIIAQARGEAQKAVEESRTQGDTVAKTIEKEARTEAEKIIEGSRGDIEAARDQELAGLRDQVKSISVAIAERLIGESMNDKKQSELISNFLTRLPDSAKNLSGDVTVVSAMPLDKAEQSRVSKEIGANVTFSVDPNILGGLIVRTGDRVIDGSVRSGLNELGGQLN